MGGESRKQRAGAFRLKRGLCQRERWLQRFQAKSGQCERMSRKVKDRPKHVKQQVLPRVFRWLYQ